MTTQNDIIQNLSDNFGLIRQLIQGESAEVSVCDYLGLGIPDQHGLNGAGVVLFGMVGDDIVYLLHPEALQVDEELVELERFNRID